LITDGIGCLPRPVIAADEQQWSLIDGLLSDAAGWHQDRITDCAACASRPGASCPGHQADAAQVREYTGLIAALRARDAADSDTAIFAAAAAKAASRRRARPGADDQALAAAYDELGRQLTYSRLADTIAAQIAPARALLAERREPLTMTPGDVRHLLARCQRRLRELLDAIDARTQIASRS
jgi:hypothetical protein